MPTNIVLASDDNYAQHLAVTLLSAARNTRNPRETAFYVLDAGISEVNRARLTLMAESAKVELHFVQGRLGDVGDIPLKRYGQAALLRITMAELLPESVTRAIYMDCDIVVLDDLTPLAEMDLAGLPVAAVKNLGHQPTERLGIPEGGYFNSGVLVFDLEQWRQRNLGQAVLDYMTANRDRLRFPDQDGLNAVLHGQWQPLPLRWNQQPATYSIYGKLPQSDSRKSEFREAVVNPGIVHYLGRNKPWEYMTFHPLKEFYWRYLDETPWQGAACAGKTPLNILKKSLMVEKNLKRRQRRRLGPAITS